MKRILNPKFSLVLLLLLATLSLVAQTGDNIDKSYSWSYKLKADGVIELSNYDCDIIIHTWDQEKVDLRIHVLAELKTDDDAERMDQNIEDLEFDNSPSKVILNTRFWESRINVMGRKTMRFKRGQKILYRSFKMKAELWIPKTANLELNSKYSKIEFEEMEGELLLNLYNDKLVAGNINGNMDITAKYTSFQFKNCKDIKADLYDCDFSSSEAGTCNYLSKYSKVSSTIVRDLTINSYNDKYDFETCGDINIESKYTDLLAKKAGKVNINSYEGSYKINQCLNMEISSKYTDFVTDNTQDMLATNMYEGSISCASINSLIINESKYVDYKLGVLNKSLKLDNGYEDNFFIDKLSSDFEAMELNGKYIKCETAIDDDFQFRIKANITYPHLDLEKANLTTRIKVKESSKLEYEAYTGEVNESLALISLSGYELKFTLK